MKQSRSKEHVRETSQSGQLLHLRIVLHQSIRYLLPNLVMQCLCIFPLLQRSWARHLVSCKILQTTCGYSLLHLIILPESAMRLFSVLNAADIRSRPFFRRSLDQNHEERKDGLEIPRLRVTAQF